MDMQAFNEQIIEEFRANGGKVAMFAEHPMVILHTVGAKSGAVRLIPLVLTLSDDEPIFFASFAGSKKDPAWVHNLRATPGFRSNWRTAHLWRISKSVPLRKRRAESRIR